MENVKKKKKTKSSNYLLTLWDLLYNVDIMLENGWLKSSVKNFIKNKWCLTKMFYFLNGKNVNALIYWNTGLNGLAKGWKNRLQ